MGRNTTNDKTEEDFNRDFEYICMEVDKGIALRKCCTAFMSLDKFYKMLAASPEKAKRYALACEARSDAIFEDILDIADDSSADKYEAEDGTERTDTEAIQRSKLRVDARKWMLSKLAPKKYGDKIEIDANVKGEIQTVTIFKLPDNGR